MTTTQYSVGDEVIVSGVWYSIAAIVREPGEDAYIVLVDQDGEEITTTL